MRIASSFSSVPEASLARSFGRLCDPGFCVTFCFLCECLKPSVLFTHGALINLAHRTHSAQWHVLTRRRRPSTMPLPSPRGVHHTVASVTVTNEPAPLTDQRLIILMIKEMTENEIATILLLSQQRNAEKVNP